jgi:hypothetical protein
MKSQILWFIVIRVKISILKKPTVPLTPPIPEREREHKNIEEIKTTPYRITHFTLVKNSVQITAIGDLFTIHRCYDVTQNEPTIGITFSWLQALQHRD